MYDFPKSKLLEELIEHSKKIDGKEYDFLSAERLFVALIDKILSNDDKEMYEDYPEVESFFCSVVKDFGSARKILIKHIKNPKKNDFFDINYMLSIIRESWELNPCTGEVSLSLIVLLKAIINKPSKTIELVMTYKEDEISLLMKEIKKLRTTLNSSVFGQENAINSFITAYFRSRIFSLKENSRKCPKATFLFIGPPGVGKTFLAESIAEALGMKNKFKVFDMSEYSNKEAALELCGSDNVYRGSKTGNLTDYVKNNPECILLFDEIEKAHISIIHLFLQILDAGRIRDSKTDEEVSLENAIVIFTTNAGRKLYEDAESTDLSLLSRKVVLNALRKDINPDTKTPYFPPAICSRFASGNVILFNYLTAPVLLKIAKEEVKKHTKSIKEKTSIEIEVEKNVYSTLLYSEGANADARAIKNCAEAFVGDELYELLKFVSADNAESSIRNVSKIKVNINLENAEPDVIALFEKKDKATILFVGDKNKFQQKKDILDKYKVITVSCKDDAIKIINTTSVDVVLLDIEYKKNQNKEVILNIEDVDSPARDIYKYLKEQQSQLPVYILEDVDIAFTEEEKLSLKKRGIRDFIDFSEETALKENLDIIVDEIYQQACVCKLWRQNKLLTYETSQKISKNGDEAIIQLFDFKLEVAVDVEDKKDILSTVLKPDVKFNDIIGCDEAKKELEFYMDYLKHPYEYVGSGLEAPRGLLLYGPPGTGKTMLAKAMANEADVTFIATEGNRFLKSMLGEGSQSVHKLFKQARKYAPAIIYIDEIDSIAKDRGVDGATDSVLNAFLSEIDGFFDNKSKPVFVLASTNFDIESGGTKSLDSAIIRRFDRCIYIDLPNKDNRISFLKNKREGNRAIQISDTQIHNIAMRSVGMSLSELAAVVELALRAAIRENQHCVTDAIFEEAFEIYNNGEKKNVSESQLERVAVHEAGHALVCYLSGKKPSYLTIVSRGKHSGYMQYNENETLSVYTKKELLSIIRTSLAGRASEMIYYDGDEGLSSAAVGDLLSATKLAQQIVCSYGMESNIGLASISESAAINGMLSVDIRNAVNKILDKEMQNALKLIEKNKNCMNLLIKELLDKNHLSEAEMKEIFDKTEEG